MSEKIRILVADKLSQVGIDWLENQSDVQVDNKPLRDPAELAADIGKYDGVIIRSGVNLKGEVMNDTGRLKGIARAGVGVDNIDVPLATSRGIMVMNTPDGNTLSTAELTWSLILSLSRKIAPANHSLKEGQWDRKKFKGTQVAGKTLGVVGLGRIGKAVAERALGFDMRVIAYDPYFDGGGEGTIEHVKDIGELCKRADYITVHVPKNDLTTGMIGVEQFKLMKPTARVINAARGGVVDPEALLDAISTGRIAGAALDVYTFEPPETEAEKALVKHDNVLCVPHLGASTEEAQQQVAIDAAQQLVEALRGGEVRNALNAPGFGSTIPEILQPYTELLPRMGYLLSGITSGVVKKVEVLYRGPISEMNVKPVTTFFLVGLLQSYMDEPVNVINAPSIAGERGIEVNEITTSKIREFSNMVEVTITTDKMTRTAMGTIFGKKFPRIISVDGYHMELRPEGNVVVILNEDKPGALGCYGTLFGEAGINIADLTFSRKKSGMAMVGLNLDQEPSEEVMKKIRSLEQVENAWYMKLSELPFGRDESE